MYTRLFCQLCFILLIMQWDLLYGLNIQCNEVLSYAFLLRGVSTTLSVVRLYYCNYHHIACAMQLCFMTSNAIHVWFGVSWTGLFNCVIILFYILLRHHSESSLMWPSSSSADCAGGMVRASSAIFAPASFCPLGCSGRFLSRFNCANWAACRCVCKSSRACANSTHRLKPAAWTHATCYVMQTCDDCALSAIMGWHRMTGQILRLGITIHRPSCLVQQHSVQGKAFNVYQDLTGQQLKGGLMVSKIRPWI